MKKKRFQSMLHEVFNRMAQLTASKGEEYARSEDDQLANFKRSGAEAGISPEQTWVVFFNKHIDSIKHHIKTPKVELAEPIIGRIDDAILYLILLRAMIVERDGIILPGEVSLDDALGQSGNDPYLQVR
jgi:hypothetical protein